MMKKGKLILLLMIGLSATAVFTGCSKDEDEPEPKPTISITDPSGGSATVNSGDSVKIGFSASSNNELKKVTLTRTAGGSTTTLMDSTMPNNTNSFSFSKKYMTGAPGTEVYTITVRDKKDLESVENITITVESDIKSFTATILGNQNSSTGSFYNVIDNMVMSQASAKSSAAMVDFVYYHGATNGATIAAPDDAPAGTIYNNANTGLQTWSVRNSTRFKPTTLTVAQFNNVSTKAELDAQASGASLSAETALTVGDVFAFVTDASRGSKSGLVKVVAITGDDNTAGTITFDVKVAK